MEFDLISANYNNAKYLPKYFDSLVESSLRPTNVIIVDDGSTDGSIEIIKSYTSKLSIKLIINEHNLGFANSLNKALAVSQSPLFARLDPDDYVGVNRFKEQVKFLVDNPSIDILGSNTEYIKNLVKLKNSNVSLSHAEIDWQLRQGIMPIIHGSIMARSRIVVNFRYKQQLVPAEDYDLFAYCLAEGYKFANLKDSLTMVNIHDGSVSDDLKFEAVQFRFKLAKQYFDVNKTNFEIRVEFLHQKYYRRFLSESSLFRYLYLMMSALLKPSKIILRAKRLFIPVVE